MLNDQGMNCHHDVHSWFKLDSLAKVAISALIAGSLFALSPTLLINTWPWPAVFPLALIIILPGIPPVRMLIPAALALLSTVFSSSPYVMIVGFVWWLLLLVLFAGSLMNVNRDDLADSLVLAGSAHGLFVLLLPPMGSRGIGYLSNANVAGALLAMLLPVAVYRRRWSGVVIMAAALLYTRSVGAIAGAALGIAVLAAQNDAFRTWIYQHKRLAVSVLFLAFLGMLAEGLLILPGRMGQWSDRLLMWGVALRAFLVHPLGNGPLSFAWTWNQAGPHWAGIGPKPFLAGYRLDYWPAYVHAHNLILTVAAEFGIPGLAGLLLLIRGRVQGAAMAGLIALAAQNVVDATALHPVIAFATAGLIALSGESLRWSVNLASCCQLRSLSFLNTIAAMIAIMAAIVLLFLAPIAWDWIAGLYAIYS